MQAFGPFSPYLALQRIREPGFLNENPIRHVFSQELSKAFDIHPPLVAYAPLESGIIVGGMTGVIVFPAAVRELSSPRVITPRPEPYTPPFGQQPLETEYSLWREGSFPVNIMPRIIVSLEESRHNS